MITAQEHAAIRAKLATYDAWSEQFKQRNGWTVIPETAVPPVSVTNGERSQVEVFEFCRDKPDRYFAYVRKPRYLNHVGLDRGYAPEQLNGKVGHLITWTGDNLGAVFFGKAYRDSFGGTRVPITVLAITNERYHGTYFASSGDYCRIRKAKA